MKVGIAGTRPSHAFKPDPAYQQKREAKSALPVMTGKVASPKVLPIHSYFLRSTAPFLQVFLEAESALNPGPQAVSSHAAAWVVGLQVVSVVALA